MLLVIVGEMNREIVTRVNFDECKELFGESLTNNLK